MVPGFARTFTLIGRIAYMLTEKKVDPESIFISTFIEKTAKEIQTHISSKILEHGLNISINTST